MNEEERRLAGEFLDTFSGQDRRGRLRRKQDEVLLHKAEEIKKPEARKPWWKRLLGL